MKRTVKVKANAMEEADVKFVSLVTRPASRIPFRVMKSEDEPEEGKMINLTRLFKRDGEEAQPRGCVLAGVVLQKQHVAQFEPKLKELGLKIDDLIEQDDCIIMKQVDYDEADVTLIKLGEMAGLFTGVPEELVKRFDDYPDSDNFGENMSKTGFLPGMMFATEMMVETVRNVLRSAEGPDSARTNISTTIDAYKAAVMDMAQSLPEVAFKIEEMELASIAADAPVVEIDTPEDEDDDEKEVTKSEDPVEEVQKDDTPAPAENKDGLTPEEQERLKSVHIEDLDVEPAQSDQAEVNEVVHKADCPGSHCKGCGDTAMKAEEPKNELAAVLSSFKSEVLEAVSGVRAEVSALSKKQDELSEKVEKTADVAEQAHKAVKGTVPSHSDSGDRIEDESLGTRRSKGEPSEDGFWGGTALDRIVGDVG